jgi:nucleoside-diphosphate-sugar epimerase
MRMIEPDPRGVVLITGATGNLGRSLAQTLGADFRVVGLDLRSKGTDFPVLEADFTSDASVGLAMHKFRDAYGGSASTSSNRSSPAGRTRSPRPPPKRSCAPNTGASLM